MTYDNNENQSYPILNSPPRSKIYKKKILERRTQKGIGNPWSGGKTPGLAPLFTKVKHLTIVA